MAVIAADAGKCRIAALALSLTLFGAALALPAHTEDAPDVRNSLGKIASGLAANDPSDAMQPFSKSLPNYGKLRDYFTGLTNGFTIVNEIDVLNQEGSDTTIRWSMTVSSMGGNHTTQRVETIHLRMAREKKNWKIVEFSPIDLFDPGQAQTPTEPKSEPQ